MQSCNVIRIVSWPLYRNTYRIVSLLVIHRPSVWRNLWRTISWSRERLAYNVNTMNGCKHYKVGAIRRRKDMLLNSDCKYISIFKEFATDCSNVSFEQCRVVLVWRFYDHRCRHSVMFTQRGVRHKRQYAWVIIIIMSSLNALFIEGFIVLVSRAGP